MTVRKSLGLSAFCLAAALLASCGGVPRASGTHGADDGLLDLPAPAYPETRFAVISDAHLYDTGLGTEGKAFQRDMLSGRKLLSATPEILTAALRRVEESGARFLLVSGDLTKDGERASHLIMSRRLSELEAAGIPVFVVPGNHDVLNPQASRYDETGASPVPFITPEEFASIYNDFGYGEALYRDPGSLSYVAEPVPGLWLLAVDSADYAGNVTRGHYKTGPGLTPQRAAWIRGMLAEALRQDRAVIVLMHHGAMEHYAGNAKFYPQYIVNGWEEFSRMLAAYRARVAFTGHFHAQDVTLRKDADGRFLYDIETGSLATCPDPVRAVSISADQRMTVDSSFITALPSYQERGVDFGKYSEDFSAEAGAAIGIETMRGLGVSKKDAAVLAPQVSGAVIAHYRGDERFTGTVMLGAPTGARSIGGRAEPGAPTGAPGLGLMGNLLVSLRKDLVAGLWTDLPPADNDLVIDLSSGEWTAAD